MNKRVTLLEMYKSMPNFSLQVVYVKRGSETALVSQLEGGYPLAKDYYAFLWGGGGC